jgi:hypothetical protein
MRTVEPVEAVPAVLEAIFDEMPTRYEVTGHTGGVDCFKMRIG